jgi:hypothetical protein
MNAVRLLKKTSSLLTAVALIAPLFVAGKASPALACSGGAIPPPAERFAPSTSPEDAIIGPNSIVALGSVVNETPVGTQYQSAYVSNVDVVVPFYGTMGSTIKIGPNGFGAPDCSGGPRLFAGEKVLLFLYPSRGLGPFSATFPPYQGEQGDWQSGQFGTPIIFDGDDAYYLSWARFSNQGNGADQEQRFYVGKSADVLRLVLNYFNPTPAEQEAAYQFVLGTSAPRVIPQGAGKIVPPAAGDGGLVNAR